MTASDHRSIEAPDAEFIAVESIEELERLRVEWKQWAFQRVSALVVEVLRSEGVPSHRIAALAAPNVAKLYAQMAEHADAAAAEIERDILGAAQH